MSAKPIEYDNWVKTADGSVGRVREVYHPCTEPGVYSEHKVAVVWIDNNQKNDVTLPVSELKRITDPNRKRPPIEGMPTDRPRCPFCDKKLLPVTRNEYERADPGNPQSYYTGKVIKRTFEQWRGYKIAQGNHWDKFCTLTCAWDFAAAAYRAGHRIVRKK